MKRQIKPVVKKVNIHEAGNDFAYWQSQPYEARLAALEEIRREYHAWINSTSKETADVHPGFQRICRIIKRS
jgi:hypothetical protein